jgi:hypothetical protein
MKPNNFSFRLTILSSKKSCIDLFKIFNPLIIEVADRLKNYLLLGTTIAWLIIFPVSIHLQNVPLHRYFLHHYSLVPNKFRVHLYILGYSNVNINKFTFYRSSTFFEMILVPFTITKSGFMAFNNAIVVSEFTDVTNFILSLGISVI